MIRWELSDCKPYEYQGLGLKLDFNRRPQSTNSKPLITRSCLSLFAPIFVKAVVGTTLNVFRFDAVWAPVNSPTRHVTPLSLV